MKKLFGLMLTIFSFWTIFAGVGGLFFIGEHYWGGLLSESYWPMVIYFSGAPVVFMIGVSLFCAGTELLEN